MNLPEERNSVINTYLLRKTTQFKKWNLNMFRIFHNLKVSSPSDFNTVIVAKSEGDRARQLVLVFVSFEHIFHDSGKHMLQK